jgi:hypothetical protein
MFYVESAHKKKLRSEYLSFPLIFTLNFLVLVAGCPTADPGQNDLIAVGNFYLEHM